MHKIRPVNVPKLPAGGACTTLAPGIAAKYFDKAEPYSFEAQTAIAICRRCPIADMCPYVRLEPVRTDKAGRKIRIIQEWDRYNRGTRKDKPSPLHQRRRPRRYKEPESLADRAAREYHRKADMSFEERVYIVFKDAKAGRYKSLNDAIKAIVILHQQALEEVK